MRSFLWRWLAAGIAILFFIGVIVLGITLASNTVAPRGGSLEAQGEQIFQREGCVFCHSIPGYRPAPQDVAQNLPYLQRLGMNWSRNKPDLVLEPGKRTDDWRLAYLLNPTAVLPGSTMPSYAGLPDDELRALIAFLHTSRSPTPTPVPDFSVDREVAGFLGEAGILNVLPTRASYFAGREVYRVYCKGCHGLEGNGKGPVGHLLWPEPRDFTDTAWMSKRSDTYLLTVIKRGKPVAAMPGYDDALTAEEQAVVLYYLKFYTNPSARQSLEGGFVTEMKER